MIRDNTLTGGDQQGVEEYRDVIRAQHWTLMLPDSGDQTSVC